ncbi:MAG: serpin family protein, partial [Bacteroidales bacterium]|nr:serpin family protein [Bacteroidales bacterium]
QKCVVRVNETGTEAAAVTAVMMRLTSAGPNQEKPIEMNVNRPFIYVLAETTTDTPLFIGIMNK